MLELRRCQQAIYENNFMSVDDHKFIQWNLLIADIVYRGHLSSLDTPQERMK